MAGSRRALGIILGFSVSLVGMLVACASADRDPFTTADTAEAGPSGPQGFADGGADGNVDPVHVSVDPTTCAEASALRTYEGCDFWPTITANPVWEIFDYAVAIANTSSDIVQVSVTGPAGFSTTATVAPSSVTKVLLPWVPELKGAPFDTCGAALPLTVGSVISRGGAYHIVTSRPVTAYQFNALEYRSGAGADAGGKDWSSCPGLSICEDGKTDGGRISGCFSYSNDASLLLPSTAMTGTYRVTGAVGDQGGGGTGETLVAITATTDATTVTFAHAGAGSIPAPGPIASSLAPIVIHLDRGDVAEIFDTVTASGSLVTADHPVQVLSGSRCSNIPSYAGACDHLEETVLPAESWGKKYVVTRPTGPASSPAAHLVAFYANPSSEPLELTYEPAAPAGCPAKIFPRNGARVATCDPVTSDFVVTSNEPFAVGLFMYGGSLVDPNAAAEGRRAQGDPSQSLSVPVEQYRTRYSLLAPSDYNTSFLDIVSPADTSLLLDGVAIAAPRTALGGTGFGVTRVMLATGGSGAHTLEGTRPVGVQVLGYGDFTSYQVPGGMDLQQLVDASVIGPR